MADYDKNQNNQADEGKPDVDRQQDQQGGKPDQGQDQGGDFGGKPDQGGDFGGKPGQQQ